MSNERSRKGYLTIPDECVFDIGLNICISRVRRMCQAASDPRREH